MAGGALVHGPVLVHEAAHLFGATHITPFDVIMRKTHQWGLDTLYVWSAGKVSDVSCGTRSPTQDDGALLRRNLGLRAGWRDGEQCTASIVSYETRNGCAAWYCCGDKRKDLVDDGDACVHESSSSQPCPTDPAQP